MVLRCVFKDRVYILNDSTRQSNYFAKNEGRTADSLMTRERANDRLETPITPHDSRFASL